MSDCLVREAGAAGCIGAATNAAPANYSVGNIQFRNTQLPADVADEVMEQMADSIVALTHEVEEANARIAVLEEERKILANERDEARATVLKLRRERAAQDKVIQSYRDDACRESCREKEAADRIGGNYWANI